MRHRFVDADPTGRAARHVDLHELARERGLEHARVVREPGQIGAASRIADDGTDAVLRERIGQIRRDRARLEDQRAVVSDRGHLAVRVRILRIPHPGAVAAPDRDDLDLVRHAELLEEPDEP